MSQFSVRTFRVDALQVSVYPDTDRLAQSVAQRITERLWCTLDQ